MLLYFVSDRAGADCPAPAPSTHSSCTQQLRRLRRLSAPSARIVACGTLSRTACRLGIFAFPLHRSLQWSRSLHDERLQFSLLTTDRTPFTHVNRLVALLSSPVSCAVRHLLTHLSAGYRTTWPMHLRRRCSRRSSIREILDCSWCPSIVM